jgi:hypothetical protein
VFSRATTSKHSKKLYKTEAIGTEIFETGLEKNVCILNGIVSPVVPQQLGDEMVVVPLFLCLFVHIQLHQTLQH